MKVSLICEKYFTPKGDVLEICVVKGGGFCVGINNLKAYENMSLPACRRFVYTFIMAEAHSIL